MRYVFRALAIMMALGLVLNLAVAQKSLKELPDGADQDLYKPGDRESHQGADNPMQGSRGKRGGSPDPYGGETFKDFIEKAEIKLNDPQWQLKLDMQYPKRIVVDNPDGTAREYWYVLFRVINDNTRKIKNTTLPTLHGDEVDPGNPKDPLQVIDNMAGADERQGVPADAHLDFELHVFNRDIERDPWDTAWPEDPENEVLTPEGLEQRRANMKRVYRPVSNHYVLQRVAAKEGLYEWQGNWDFISEPVMLLHPLSDFQRQVGFEHDLSAPDYSGPRCLPYRFVVFRDGARTEDMRFVAVYSDNAFAGFYGKGDTLPEGARLVDSGDDVMWGKLTARRYLAGDCVDRYGRPLRANDPGYLNARVAGGRQDDATGYGMLKAEDPKVGTPVNIPHVRFYKDGDHVLFNHDTGLPHKEFPNANYRINGKIVGPGDPRHGEAEAISGSTEMFGGRVVGKPVKQIDQRGRAIRRYIVTYQAGDVLTQAEWDIYRRRLGPAILNRYKDIGNIVGRPLTANDPVVGLPKIKLGYYIGEEDRKGEVIDRGVDTGRRGPKGEVILQSSPNYKTGREYKATDIGPEDFMRDPDGEFTTNRVAPVPDNSGLRDGEEYIYAPLGAAGDDAVPVPAFNQYGAWKDYVDELSGSRIPLYDEKGDLVRDIQDQILYLKEYEYEYVYLYEFAPVSQDDDGFKGAHGGEKFKLVNENIRFAVIPKTVKRTDAQGNVVEEKVEVALPLSRLIIETRMVDEPIVVDGYELRDPETGTVTMVTAQEYEQRTGSVPDPDKVVNAKIVTTTKTEDKVVVGVFVEGKALGANQKAESWEEAEARVQADGGRVENRPVLRYVNRFRNAHAATNDPSRFPSGAGPTDDDFETSPVEDNNADFDQIYKTWSRWTVPPPMVYRDEQGQWQVITRFADKYGPGRRWDDGDAPRFLTRYVSEMWGVAIFENVSRDWDFANVYVRGLRHTVSSAGLKQDGTVPDLKSPVDGQGAVSKTFFKPRMVTQEWIYRVRYERLGDEYENFADLVRKTRSFWYLDTAEGRAEAELGN
ncbi:MAG: hypothetical protein KF696_12250 [Planctomycetes bacterium]|nr:hypothetical protein [Planctomycetota bacterium]MCW8136572.1 hypothetical protein [Planctomycetota bacterium]